MTEQELMLFHVLEVKRGNCFEEIHDYTKQIAECMDRNDTVAVRMLLKMRVEPILKLAGVKEETDTKVASLSPEDATYLRKLRQAKNISHEYEKSFYLKTAAVEKTRVKMIELDKRINQRVVGKSSVYNK